MPALLLCCAWSKVIKICRLVRVASGHDKEKSGSRKIAIGDQKKERISAGIQFFFFSVLEKIGSADP